MQTMRILGVLYDPFLNFQDYVFKVTNSMRVRINSLRKLKKVGMGIEMALQYAVCIRSFIHFGLFWMCHLSKTSWNELEKVWNIARITAIHQKCSQSFKIEKLEELSGLKSIRNFANYLLHLRTKKLENFEKCDRFTPNTQEIELLRQEFQPSNHSTSKIERRPATISATTKSVTPKAHMKLQVRIGEVKTYIVKLAIAENWSIRALESTKCQLRRKYSVPRKKIVHTN